MKTQLLLLAALALPLSACAPEDEGAFQDEYIEGAELWDEGPTPDEAAEDLDLSDAALIAAGTPNFQLPFPCDQVWAGQTRTNHSPTNAVDFNRTDDLGDPVVAAAAGTVSRVENFGTTSYGRWIEINHGGGHTTRYAHLSSQLVSVGEVVAQGEEIGTVGNTGGSSGAHLHYEQRLNGSAVRARFNNVGALYFGTKNYQSKNCPVGVQGTIDTNGVSLNVRSGPSTSFSVVGSVADGQTVTITCQKVGQTVTGTYGTSNIWDFIGNGYVADAFVFTGSNGVVAPPCP